MEGGRGKGGRREGIPVQTPCMQIFSSPNFHVTHVQSGSSKSQVNVLRRPGAESKGQGPAAGLSLRFGRQRRARSCAPGPGRAFTKPRNRQPRRSPLPCDPRTTWLFPET